MKISTFALATAALLLSAPTLHAKPRARKAKATVPPRRELLSMAKLCHERAVKNVGPLSGKVTLRVTLAENGDVVRGSVEHSEIADSGLLSCIERNLPAAKVSNATASELPRDPISFLVPVVFT